MPVTHIKNIGDVEYELHDLPEDIKGKTMLGDLHAPIKISHVVAPGAKQDYIVAHEAGHRLVADMVEQAYKESPAIFEKAPDPQAGLVRYWIDLGLKKEDVDPLHPGTVANLRQIFIDNQVGKWTPELIAQEFIAEVYANWATGRGTIPATIAKRFRSLTDLKNEYLKVPVRSAAWTTGEDHENQHAVFALFGIALWIIFNQGNSGGGGK